MDEDRGDQRNKERSRKGTRCFKRMRHRTVYLPASSRVFQERVKAIGRRYPWNDPTGANVEFFSTDEAENLAIRAGTLTTQERQIINHHIDVTIKMLEALPGPGTCAMCRSTQAVTTNGWMGKVTRAASRRTTCRCKPASWASPTSSRR